MGGNMVHESEYVDMVTMMENIGFYEMDNIANYYTWSNQHVNEVIYSRTDRVLANVEWFQMHMNINFTIMAPGILDHALLYLESQTRDRSRRRPSFKFLNNVTTMEGYKTRVANSWREPITGMHMYVVWKKFQRIQPFIRSISKPLIGINHTLKKAKDDLLEEIPKSPLK